MVYEIQIITAVSNGLLTELDQRFCWLEERGYSLARTVNHDSSADRLFLDIKLIGTCPESPFRNEDMVYIFKHQLSEFLAEHIVRDWEPILVWKETCKRNRQIVPTDRQIVYDKACTFLKHCNSSESLNLLMNYGRKNRMVHKIMDYLYSHSELSLEGFIQFCMRDYLTEIRFAVDLAHEELKNEQEYNEFVKLLRYFVDTQPSRIYEVNLLIDKHGNYVLWDGNGDELNGDLLHYYMDDLLVNNISLDDVLVSILITVAPRNIILHNVDGGSNSEPVRMIRNVFEERIHECRGCDRCSPPLNDYQISPYSSEP